MSNPTNNAYVAAANDALTKALSLGFSPAKPSIDVKIALDQSSGAQAGQQAYTFVTVARSQPSGTQGQLWLDGLVTSTTYKRFFFYDQGGWRTITPAELVSVPQAQTLAPNAVETALSSATGAVVANLIPRTDTFANLAALSANAGEISTATDSPAIFKHNGIANGAIPFMPFGTHYAKTFAALTNTITVPAYAYRTRLNFDTTAGNIAATVGIANGYFPGQKMFLEIFPLNVFNTVTITAAASITAGNSFLPGYWYELCWNNVTWDVTNFSSLTVVTGGYSLLGGTTYSTGVAIGPGAITQNNDNQLAVSGGFEINLQTAYDSGIQAGSNACRILNTLKLTTTATTANQELTIDGTAAASGTRYTFILGESGLVRARIHIMGRQGTSGSNAWSNTYDALYSLNTSGQATLVGSVAAGTAIAGGTFVGAPPTGITIAATGNKVSIVLTPGSATSTNWTATLDFTKVLM